ncbi:transketolase C-terminal domain-containing protein [Microbacterium sp. QXD-8]|uniref:Transketolase C-terminal domain-containing protein n=1 Tax=Microbacterium psychrotolerans TaxID=3068321 RepID=A0ABU0YXK2_9MICO|nr:transketolase C-terminal domain-containing protein [Microbacterium sp. QXD-8]MDQ7876510.1 transketolase C-terminal domain-containing protein [Microbacterium sp. QXD-8]
MPDTVIKRASYAEAINAALGRALRERSEVLVFGEDVALPGGVFGVTKGLQRQFGDRVFDMPISESAILGGAVGAGLFGARSVVEIMWADFSLVALDQLVNQAANVRYISRGMLASPITVRTQQGNAPGACAQHSQSLEALFAHIPGLQVCMPTTPQDAYDLLLTSIWSDDPTIVIENRTLYHGDKVDITTGGPVQPIDGAQVRRQGSDITLVTWGSTQFAALDAASVVAREGIDVEVIDMRWIRPLDHETVLASVERTGRLAIAHEAHTTGGVGAEIAARVAEHGLRLTSPIVRIGTPDVRIPAAPHLAQAVIPSAARIADAIRRACVLNASFAGGTVASHG